MHIIVNPQQMRALEARAFSLGVPSLLLMALLMFFVPKTAMPIKHGL